MSTDDLSGWTPIHVFHGGGQPGVDWARFDGIRFTESFFEQTIARALREPARLMFRKRTPVAALEGFASRHACVRPRGFIFHLSRCGSTLAAQMLAALPTNIVLSEAPPIDQVLRLSTRVPNITHEQRIAWLRGMIAALGQQRTGDERHLFIKFDSWHVLELPLLREAFPDVPWIFLYRDPVEVMVSQQRQRGTQMIPGVIDPRIFGIELAMMPQLSLDEYCARVLARICTAASMNIQVGGGRLVNFNELPSLLWTELGGFFGVDWSHDDLERMRQTAQSNSKTPALPHVDDRVAKQQAASDQIRRLSAIWLDAIYATLEAQRTAQVGRNSASVRAASDNSNSRNQSFTTQSITR